MTSPPLPYWGLRQYAGEQREWWGEWYGALGLEPTPELYVEHMVSVFREVRRVVRKDGTLWLNLGDSYAASGRGGNPSDSPHQKQATNRGSTLPAGLHESQRQAGVIGRAWAGAPSGYKQKDLVGIPWMVAFALRADGWYLRSDIIWSKPNQMPESVTDRPTKAHEYLFLLAKSQRYFYDADAIREEAKWERWSSKQTTPKYEGREREAASRLGREWTQEELDRYADRGRNKRTVWNIATRPYPGAHFATFPEALVEPCILAGSKAGDVVLDQFNGSGTTGRVAIRHGRSYVGLDISSEYLKEQATKRIDNIQTVMGLP